MWIGVIGVSSLTALIETAIVLWCKKYSKNVSGLILAVFIVLNILFLATDLFLIKTFDTIIGYQILFLIGNTTTKASAFASSYLPFGTIVMLLTVTAIICAAVWRTVRMLGRRTSLRLTRIYAVCFSAAGIGMIAWIILRYILVGSYNSDYQCTPLSRVAFSLARIHIEHARVNRFVTVTETTPASARPEFDVILIVGESYSRLHSPLYGYDKPTTPNLTALVADSSLVVFTDVMAPGDWTEEAVKGIFSLSDSPDTYSEAPFFPALFRKSGYRTAIYENQYTVGSSDCLLSDARLSEISFDVRNKTLTRYDHQLTDSIVLFPEYGLYVIHLRGQHFEYANRYPSEWQKFHPEDYDKGKYTAYQRQILANYDSATLYNDMIMGNILSRWAERPAVAIYLSDHGEELFECRDYFGHGNSASSPDPMYQLRVPMMIWMSYSFKTRFPEKASALYTSASLPVSSNDIGHLILDLADIDTPATDTSRSAISPDYNEHRKRNISYYSGATTGISE